MDTEQIFLALCKVNPDNDEDLKYTVNFVNNTAIFIDKIEIEIGGKITKSGELMPLSRTRKSVGHLLPGTFIKLNESDIVGMEFEIFYHVTFSMKDTRVSKHFSLHTHVCQLPMLETVPVIGCQGLVITAGEEE